ncbi:hypothetical protein B9Z19DRAFT_1071610, partial [Tuber borchii]
MEEGEGEGEGEESGLSILIPVPFSASFFLGNGLLCHTDCNIILFLSCLFLFFSNITISAHH